MATITKGQLFGVKFVCKVLLTPSNVPTKFHLNNQNRLGENCKILISDPKNGRHFPKSQCY